MRTMIGIFQHEFIRFCTWTQPASSSVRSVLSHEARIFLYCLRLVQDLSMEVLGALFDISNKTAMKVYDDVLWFLLFNDPNIPRLWNDATATQEDIRTLLRRIQEGQSEGVR